MPNLCSIEGVSDLVEVVNIVTSRIKWVEGFPLEIQNLISVIEQSYDGAWSNSKLTLNLKSELSIRVITL